MIKPPFPSTSEAQSHNVTFLTIKTVVRKFHQNDGLMCLDKAVLCARWGGGVHFAPRFSEMCTMFMVSQKPCRA